MVDRIDEAFAALGRVDAPVTWDDVVARIEDHPISNMGGSGNRRAPRGRRKSLALLAAVLLTVLVVALAVRTDRGTDSPGVSATGSSTPSTVGPTPTTEPATRSTRTFPVALWAGDRYLVWSGEAGDLESSARADGWMYEPETGKTTDIPTAPIAPRTEAVGVWTGDELIVCCGAGIGEGAAYDTGTAAAFRPSDRTWRRLAAPPAGAARSFGTAVWTGTQMIVIFTGDDPLALAYDPDTDGWRRLANPPLTARIPESVWTGDVMIVWNGTHGQVDRGYSYDPASDTWVPLPELPAGSRTSDGSIAWTGEEVIAYGASADDEARAAGARWRPGDTTWRSMSDAGLPPIEWYEGTPGSQSLVWDERSRRLAVRPVHGNESFTEGPSIMIYDPARDTWEKAGRAPFGHQQLVIGDGDILRPDRDDPVVTHISISAAGRVETDR